MLPRCRRGADIVARRMPSWFRRGYLSCRGGMGSRGLVLRKAVKAALTQLWIGDWTALSAHSRLPKAPIGFEEPIVTLALKDILSRSGAARRRVSRHCGERRQAHSETRLVPVLKLMTNASTLGMVNMGARHSRTLLVPVTLCRIQK